MGDRSRSGRRPRGRPTRAGRRDRPRRRLSYAATALRASCSPSRAHSALQYPRVPSGKAFGHVGRLQSFAPVPTVRSQNATPSAPPPWRVYASCQAAIVDRRTSPQILGSLASCSAWRRARPHAVLNGTPSSRWAARDSRRRTGGTYSPIEGRGWLGRSMETSTARAVLLAARCGLIRHTRASGKRVGRDTAC